MCALALVSFNFRVWFREAVLNICCELHRLILPYVLLNPGVDVKCRANGIFWIDHDLGVGQKASGYDRDREFLRVRRECPKRSSIVCEGRYEKGEYFQVSGGVIFSNG